MSATEYIIKTSIPQPEPNVQVRIDNTCTNFPELWMWRPTMIYIYGVKIYNRYIKLSKDYI